ncbi:MAG TPA: aminotransferase class IV [Gammaproteobacteria bacterium]|nr:aminotransferase class IV [Gammaproteobacteria bacterium]
MTPLAWIAGTVMPLAEARIALDDPGFLLGDGVFETLRARKGKPFRWDLHAERLAAGLAVVGIAAEALAVAEGAVHELATRAAHDCDDDVYLRVQVSRLAASRAEVTALVRPLPAFPEHLYRRGARLAIADWHRDPADPLAGVKSLSYLPQVWARRAVQARGFDDALILNSFGRVCEAAHANVIARHGRVLYAPGPEEGALDGVTRRVLLAALPEDDYAVETRLDRIALVEAEELVLISTLAGVVPVSGIAGVDRLYAGAAGVLAMHLAHAYAVLLDSA